MVHYSAKLTDLWSSPRQLESTSWTTLCCTEGGAGIYGPAPHFKVIIGREEGENKLSLKGIQESLCFDSPPLMPRRTAGTRLTASCDGRTDHRPLAARLVARYSGKAAMHRPRSACAGYVSRTASGDVLKVVPLSADDIEPELVCLITVLPARYLRVYCVHCR